MRGKYLFLSRICGMAATVVFALSACGGDGGTGPVIPATGTWSGTTSQSLAVSFNITSQGITSATLDYQLSGSFCSYNATVTVGGSAPVPITNGQFNTGSIQIGGSATMSATGRFTSSTQANGTISIVDGGCNGSVNLTWNATR